VGVSLAGLVAATASGCGEAVSADVDAGTMVMASSAVEAGRYLVNIGGCNDCHTDGFAQVGTAFPEEDRLTGSVVGIGGAWGTTYPANLRLSAQNMTEDQWVEMLGTRTGLPPMPWPSVNQMSETDRRAIYRYLQALGPKGEPAAAALAPGVAPSGPWIDFNPQGL
jgi:hypothetical protein